MAKLFQLLAPALVVGAMVFAYPAHADGVAPSINNMIYHTTIASDGNSGNIQITGSVFDPDNDFRRIDVELDASGNWAMANADPMRWLYSSPQLPLGKHTFRMRTMDYAGNVNTSGVYNFELFKCIEFTSNNVVHVKEGRATVSGITVYAKGSGTKMGYYTIFATTKLAETGKGYYIVGSCSN
jgi:hypothetical protein